MWFLLHRGGQRLIDRRAEGQVATRRRSCRRGMGVSRRVNADLLLVGSLPVESSEEAFRYGTEYFGDLTFALPDGETGARQGWVSYERERLARPTPGVAVLEETASPTGLPRHAFETPVFGLDDGVTEIEFGPWPRIDDAIE